MLVVVFIDRLAEELFCISAWEKSLVVRIPLTAVAVNSSVAAGFIVCEAVEGGMFLIAGLAHGSVDGSPPNESCLTFLFGFGVAGGG